MTYIRCPHCGAKALHVATMCPQCRAPLSQNPMEAGRHGLEPCHRCKKFIERDVEICPFCSYRVRRGRAMRRWLAGGTVAVAVVAAGTWGLVAGGGIDGLTAWFDSGRAPRPAPAAAAPAVTPAVDELPPTAAPLVAATPPPPRVTVRTLARWARNWANVRDGRNTGAAVVAVLRPGDRVQVSDPVAGWWTVWRDTVRVGFVASDLLSATPVAPDSLP